MFKGQLYRIFIRFFMEFNIGSEKFVGQDLIDSNFFDIEVCYIYNFLFVILIVY